jgi:hypothetical protein
MNRRTQQASGDTDRDPKALVDHLRRPVFLGRAHVPPPMNSLGEKITYDGSVAAFEREKP